MLSWPSLNGLTSPAGVLGKGSQKTGVEHGPQETQQKISRLDLEEKNKHIMHQKEPARPRLTFLRVPPLFCVERLGF